MEFWLTFSAASPRLIYTQFTQQLNPIVTSVILCNPEFDAYVYQNSTDINRVVQVFYARP